MGAAGAAVGLGLQAVGTIGSLAGGGNAVGGNAISDREVELILHKWEKYDKRLLENEENIRQQVLEQNFGEEGFAEALFQKEVAQLQSIRDASLADMEYQLAQAESEVNRRIFDIANQQLIGYAESEIAAGQIESQMGFVDAQRGLLEQRRQLLDSQIDLLMGDIDRRGAMEEFDIARGGGERDIALDQAGFQQEYEVGDVRRRVQDVAFSGEFNREFAEANVRAAQQGREFTRSYSARAAENALTQAKAARDTGIAQAEGSRFARLNQLINQWADTEEDAARIKLSLGTADLSGDVQVRRIIDRAAEVTNQTVEAAQFQSSLARETGEFGVAQANVRGADIRSRADIESLEQLIEANRGALQARADENIGNVKSGRQLEEALGLLAMGDDERDFLRRLGGMGDTIATQFGRQERQSQRDQLNIRADEQRVGFQGQELALQNQLQDLLASAQRGQLGISPMGRYPGEAALRDIIESRNLTNLYSPYVEEEILRNYDRNFAASETLRDTNRGSLDIRDQLNTLNSRAATRQSAIDLSNQLLSGIGSGGGGGGGGAGIAQAAKALGSLVKQGISLFGGASQPSPRVSPVLQGYSNLIPGFSGDPTQQGFTGATADLPSFGGPSLPGRFTGGSASLPAFRQPSNFTSPSLFTQAPASSFQIDNSVQFQGFGNF